MILMFCILHQEEDFPKRYCERLFGKNVTVEEAMAAMDENNDGVVQNLFLRNSLNWNICSSVD